MLDLKLDARQFAVGWINTALFASEDEGRPTLYRSARLDATSAYVDLTTTDTYTSATTRVPTDEHGEAFLVPDGYDVGTWVVADPDRRLHALCSFILRDTKGDAGIYAPPVHVWVQSAESSERPTLMPEMDRRQLVVTYRAEAVGVPILEAEFPDVDKLVSGHVIEETEAIALSPDFMGRFGKMKDREGEPVLCRFSGPLKPVRWVIATTPSTSGIWMPVRSRDVEPRRPESDVEPLAIGVGEVLEVREIEAGDDAA